MLRPTGEQIGKDASGTTGHRPTRRSVSRAQIKIGKACRAYNRLSVRRHRPRADPEFRHRKVAAIRGQFVQRSQQRRATRGNQPDLIRTELGSASYPDAVAESRNGDLGG